MKFVPLSHQEADWLLVEFALPAGKITQAQVPVLQGMMGFRVPQSFTSKDRRY
jgi:hypothetical protein